MMSLKSILLLFLISGLVSTSEAATVKVVDGDTIELAGVKYRLHGIDSPEAGQKCSKLNGGMWGCGNAATDALEALVVGKSVSCDNRGKDDFQRIIAVCTAGSVELNDAMVRNGYAWAFRTFSNDYVAAENAARNAGLGIWQAPTQTAEDFRRERWNVGQQQSPDGCPIKGNISKNGRIYHAPWSPWYTRTKISTDKGERWFCSEAEALEAGWRAPYWGN